MRRITQSVLVLALAVVPSGCIASNVLDVKDRTVVTELAALQWQAITADDIPGLYESVELQGDAAASLWKIHYYFADDGTYTAAALVGGDAGPRFQSRHGTWQLRDNALVLDDAPPAAVAVAPAHLRITAPTGVLILRRRELR